MTGTRLPAQVFIVVALFGAIFFIIQGEYLTAVWAGLAMIWAGMALTNSEDKK